LAKKVANLRIFPDAEGKLNFSLRDVGGGLLVVSQFTLAADTKKGLRPSFTNAMPPSESKVLFEQFVELLRATGLKVETGRFQQHMLVKIHNDGPVTILLDSKGEISW
jgi:D-tyrosyl-tRNA(Tyr) deacylase